MVEVEVKYCCDDWETIQAKLRQAGATLAESRRDTDHYFNAPDRDFARTDEAVRLRRIGTNNYITYKGPKQDAVTKTRTEIELPIAPGPDGATTAVKLLTSLGYRPVAVVSKNRHVYQFSRDGFPIEVCFDDVGTVGRFVEVEILSEPAQVDMAREVLLNVAAELGLTQIERRSYLELLLTSAR